MSPSVGGFDLFGVATITMKQQCQEGSDDLQTNGLPQED